MDADPNTYVLPELLDPLFDYLSNILPPPADRLVDSFLVPLVARGWTLLHSLYSVGLYLFNTDPNAWDMQKILPPVITLLCAYLAMLSFYRTTSWMVRTSLWFAKWGTILATLAGGAGWLAGQQANGRGLDLNGGMAGLANSVGTILWDVINSPQGGAGGRDGGSGNSRPRRRSQRTKKRESSSSKPKAWDTFDKHAEYKAGKAAGASEDRDDEGAPGLMDGKKIMGQIVGFAGKMGWLDAMKEAVDSVAKDLADKAVENAKDSVSGKNSKGKTKAGSQ
jgi:hypothetical protein